MTEFQRFERAVHRWADMLGLLDWEIHVEEHSIIKRLMHALHSEVT